MSGRTTMRLGLALMAALSLTAPAMAQPAAAPVRASAERPFLLIDQIRTPPFPAAWAPLFQPLKTLEEVETVLKSKGASYQRGRTVLDTRTMTPDLVKIIAALPPGEVFIVPQAKGVTFNRVLQALTPGAAARLKASAEPPRGQPL